MKTAVVIGATGLIGSKIVSMLLNDDRYESIKVFSRRKLKIENPKLILEIVDFEKINSWKNKIIGDEIYSALGSTIKKAGSAEERDRIDYSYQFNVLKYASENGVKACSLVSSAGANKDSKNSYLKMKGQLDEEIKKLNFEKIFIFRPSFLLGERENRRISEQIISPFIQMITSIIPPLKKYKPVFGSRVAKSMIKVMNTEEAGYKIYELEKVIQ